MGKAGRFALILWIIIAPQLLAGTVYYVATSGNDSYNGLHPSYMSGANGPVRTLQRAAGLVKPGDTVQIRGGVYQATSNWSVDGTQASPITVTNYPGEVPVIDGINRTLPADPNNPLIQIYGSWYKVSSLETRNSGGVGIMVDDEADHCTLDNITSHDNRGSGIIMRGWYGLVVNCRAYRNTLINENCVLSGSWGAGISACRNPQYATIRNCTAWNNWGEGISTFESYHTTIEDCTSYNNMTNFYISDTEYCLFQRNLAYCTPGNAIQGLCTQNNIASGNEGHVPACSHNTFINNISMGGERNFNSGALPYCVIANNTFVNASGTAGGESANVYFFSGAQTNAVFKNNIILQEDGVNIAQFDHPTGIAFGYNLWSKTPVSGCLGTGDVFGNPLLAKTGSTGAGSLSPGWFKILANSPAKDRAAVLSEVREDYFKAARGGAPDMGAHELGYDASPLTALAAGSPVSGLAPLAVNFKGTAGGGTSPYTYKWTFGDGGTSAVQDPAHTFAAVGSYVATLTVTDQASATAGSTVNINVVASLPLNANIAASPSSGRAPLAVDFSGSVTGGLAPYSYSWSFGDGGTATAQSPSHIYAAAGRYTATLTVTDSASAKANASVTVTVESTGAQASLSVAAETGAPAVGQGGTTDPPPGNYTFSKGSAVSVKSIPNTDYRFSRWVGDVEPAGMFSMATTLSLYSNMSVSATFCAKCADVNGDLNVTPADAQSAFDIYLGKINNPTWCELENGDVKCDGTRLEPRVTPSDAQWILNKYLKKGGLNSDCSGGSRTDTTVTSTAGVSAPGATMILSNAALTSGGDILIAVVVDSPVEIDAFGFDLAFPPSALQFIGLEGGELTEGYDQLGANVVPFVPATRAGAAPEPEDLLVLRVGGYKTGSARNPASGVLVTLVFRGSGKTFDPSALSLVAAQDGLKNASFINSRLVSRRDGSGARDDRETNRGSKSGEAADR